MHLRVRKEGLARYPAFDALFEQDNKSIKQDEAGAPGVQAQNQQAWFKESASGSDYDRHQSDIIGYSCMYELPI